MINIYTGNWGGKYGPEYTDRFLEGVQRNTGGEAFKVTVLDRSPSEDQGWWGKLGLFKPGFISGDFAMWVDIDTVITGPIKPVWDRYAKPRTFAAPWNWAQSGHGGVQSSLMVWDARRNWKIWEAFEAQRAHWKESLWGDQEFLTHLRETGALPITQIDQRIIKSYKYHCRSGPTPGASFVTFHGKPDPHECGGWVQQAWKPALCQ